MQKYLAYNDEGAPFDVFGTGHLLALSIIAPVVIFFIWGWRNPDEDAKRRARDALAGVMLMTRNYRLYEALYFVGIAGATQALLTPTPGIYGLPHFWAIQSLSSHGLLVTSFNYVIGSNYMFTLHKPPTVSLFDVMGPWPWYILTAEFVAIVLFSILYLPFAIRQKQPAPG